jgi:hypothetical protein
MSTNTLASGASLTSNQSLVSNNGIYILKVTVTGIVFLNNQQTGQRLWVQGRLGQVNPTLTMEPNGDLVFIEGNPPQVQWGSNTPQFLNAYAVLLDNGNLVIYDQNGDTIWSSGTAQSSLGGAPLALSQMRVALEDALARHSMLERAFPAFASVRPASSEVSVNVHSRGGNAE